ncbi:MAG: ABC transporter substrate-binding protein [Chloroflexota bacterium]|nr:ABC transporter substrate-binding protein [Chloroflexota bacterium]
MPLIGYLDSGWPDARQAEYQTLRAELARHLGEEGEGFILVPRGGDVARHAVELLEQEQVEVLVAFGTDTVRVAAETAAKGAGGERPPTPVVMASISDPLGLGPELVETLDRPGRHVTGLTSLAPQLTGKRLQILKEAFPGVARVMFLRSDSPGDDQEQLEFDEAANRLQVAPLIETAGSAAQISVAFADAVAAGADAVLAAASTFIVNHRLPVASLAAQYRLPAMYAQRELAEAGGLMAYSPNYRDMFQRAAGFVVKILDGVPPGILPIDRARRFSLVLNRQAARDLNFTVPRGLLAQLDEIL